MKPLHRSWPKTPLSMSRRQMLVGATSIVTASAADVGWSQSQAHTLRIGAVEVVVISDGRMTLPLSMALPNTPGPEIDGLFKGRGAPHVDGFKAEVNVVVIKTGAHVVAVDCGGSTDFMPTLGGFAARLEAANIKPDDVTHVVFTHAHADHLWGVIDPLDDDTRFPGAKHLMAADELNFWRQPDVDTRVPDAMRGMAIGTARRLKMIEARLEAIRPGTEIVSGVTALAAPGHTPGHMAIAISSQGQTAVIGSDALANPIVSFERPDWPWGPDIDKAQGASTRAKLLDQLAGDRALLFGYHLPWPGIGRVERAGTAFRFVQA